MIDAAFKALRLLEFPCEEHRCRFCGGTNPERWLPWVDMWGNPRTTKDERHKGHKPTCALKNLLQDYDIMKDFL